MSEKGFTANCEVVDPGTRQALGLGVVKAVLGGIPDPGPGHYGNASWYFISGFAGVDAPHLVWIINVDPSLLGQLAGAEFHSEFSPFGPLAPFHLLDLVASQLLRNSGRDTDTCSYTGGCH